MQKLNMDFSAESVIWYDDIIRSHPLPPGAMVVHAYVYIQAVTNPQNIGDLGRLVSLTAIVGNKGPSTIQEASLIINFPSRISQLTDPNFFLYPSSLGVCLMFLYMM